MSILNIGLIGFSGRLGAHILDHLIDAQNQDKLHLVILHRENSDLSKLPPHVEIETRLIQLDERGVEVTKKAVEDLDVVISSVWYAGIPSQVYLIDALASSSRIKLFIPSDYGLSWTNEELDNSALEFGHIKVKSKVIEKKANELNVPIVNVRVGCFDQTFFPGEVIGLDAQTNKIRFYRETALKYQVRITTLDYLGYALTQLSLDPSRIAGKTITLYDIALTGQEIVDVLTVIHGSPTEVAKFTEEEYQRDLKDFSGSIGAGVKKRWVENDWRVGEKVEIEGYTHVSFEDITRKWLSSVST
ncbi:uncharacterized protein IL334_004036 [Kwoniella shivajii]|uniref:NmrA-like domain-containing protein n=1 Tax=Kwoniella shivajii TaxID=564305 RepID=A0ABZ1D0Y8_9TREE|nr:hypothetical protein IL334_004036 [Kwoniella shivajii]